MRALVFTLAALFLQTNASLFNKSESAELQRLSYVFFNKITSSLKDIPGSSECADNIRTIVANLASKDPKTFYSSFEVFDSWGKIPAGLTYGRFVDMGNYKQCIDIDFQTLSYSTKKETNIVGQYCQAIVPLDDAKSMVGLKSLDMVGPARMKIKDMGVGIGICIPKSCDSHSMSTLFTRALNGVKVKVYSCSTKHQDFEVMDYFAFLIFGFIGLLMILSTFYDWYTEKQNIPRRDIYLAFSVIHNLHKLFGINYNPGPNAVTCLHGIRSISMLWVMLGHCVFWYMYSPSMNMKYMIEWLRTPHSLPLSTSPIAVDTFFFLSGFLLAWIGLKEVIKRKGKINIALMYAHRVFRLLPLVALMVLFVLSIMKFSVSAPTWPALFNFHKQNCVKNWWRTLLFIQNFESGNVCIPQTWFLAIDMQLYIVAPFILLGFYKWGNKFIAVVVIACAISFGWVYAIFYKYNFTEVISAIDLDPKRKQLIYYSPHTRFPIWLMGITYGYILEKFQDKKVNVSPVINILGWFVALSIMSSIIFGPYSSLQEDYQPSVLAAASYETIAKIAWGAALAWIIFSCHHGHGGLINDFLSHPLWQIVSKFSYCMYITHVNMQMIIFGGTQTGHYISYLELLHNFFSTFGLTLIASLISILSCEAPLNAIEKVIFSKGQPTPKPEKEEEVAKKID